MSETEIKFLVGEADFRRLWIHPVLLNRIKSARTHHSKATYFDTANQDLRKAGLSLRIRRSGGHLIQTLKQDQSSLIERGEWEREIEAPADGERLRLELDMIDDTPVAGTIGDAVRAGLKPVFEIDLERTVFPWIIGDALIEVALDQGEIRAIGARGPGLRISEVELELKRGGQAAAFALARALAAQAPLLLSLISKSERGQLLLLGAAASPAKPSEPRPRANATMRAGFRTICRACLHDLMLNVAALDGADPVEAVHQGRVALRRLRAALALFKPFGTSSDYSKMTSQLTWMARVFGAARDRDVMGAASPSPPEPPASGAAGDFSRWLEARRLAAHEAVREAVRSERWRMFLIDFCEWIEDGPWLEPSPDDRHELSRFVRKELCRRRRALLPRARALQSLDRDAQHKMRIKAKKLRYMAQFFAGLPGVAARRPMKRFLTSLNKLQSALGDLRDVEERRRMTEAEMRLWRSAAGTVEAPPLATVGRSAARVRQDGESLGQALEACARLIRTDPFRSAGQDYRLARKSSNKRDRCEPRSTAGGRRRAHPD
jgi:inorganic triphosphatase YgiF